MRLTLTDEQCETLRRNVHRSTRGADPGLIGDTDPTWTAAFDEPVTNVRRRLDLLGMRMPVSSLSHPTRDAARFARVLSAGHISGNDNAVRIGEHRLCRHID